MNWDREKLPDCIVFFLAKAYQKAHGQFKQRLKPFGLTNMQHLVLEALWHQDGFTPSELGQNLVLDKATLSGVLDRMVEGGWIEKRPAPGDLRSYTLHTTGKADDLKQQLIEARRQTNEELLAGFSQEERLLFKRFLMDFV